MDGTRANPTQREKKENVVSAIISGGTLPLDDVSSGFENILVFRFCLLYTSRCV